ncbi:hypothetical protein AAGG74_14685 [Bacillus mexicanus]|uniref:hypothetical protein n=1 Tax=Bacillus mexicanus TaxID=2834415 RepID=UPI003D1B6DBB
MIVTDFKANEEKVYKIVRDYYTYFHKREGVLFVLSNEDVQQTFSKFLPRNQMNSNYEWKKVASGDVHYVTAGIESGEESKLVIETGFIRIKSRFSQKIKTYTYRRFRFILKK